MSLWNFKGKRYTRIMLHNIYYISRIATSLIFSLIVFEEFIWLLKVVILSDSQYKADATFESYGWEHEREFRLIKIFDDAHLEINRSLI